MDRPTALVVDIVQTLYDMAVTEVEEVKFMTPLAGKRKEQPSAVMLLFSKYLK